MNISLLRRLLLPASAEREPDAVRVFAESLEELGIPEDDAEAWLSTELANWNSSGEASRDFQDTVEEILRACADERDWRISTYYFGLHSRLMSPGYGIAWAEARELLSHVRLIADLALNHRMTAARIARVLALEGEHAPRYSRALDPVLHALGSPRSLDANQVEALLDSDRLRAVSLFGDSSLREAAGTLESLAELLGVDERLEPHIRALANDGSDPFGPYLQMLHFLLVSTEFYDHFLREAYEFSPRGVVAELVFDGHPVALKSGNPFLNNAKKVRVLNEVWAEGADGNLTAARALAALLDTLDRLAYPARRELASLIRAWLAKVFDAYTDSAVDLPPSFGAHDLARLLARVATAQSRTGGILEQRLVDLFCLVQHPVPRWRHVGVGDSVNSTNVSGRKLGDVEAQDMQSVSIVAYESHGGAMGPKYVAEHMRTLSRVIAERESDLLTRAPATDWHIRVAFVAHSFAGVLPTTWNFDGGWTIHLEYCTFDQMKGGMSGETGGDHLVQLFNAHCLPVLRSKRTPNRVRSSLLATLGGT